MVTREAELLARTLAREFKIVAIIGPRQSGKTPLAQAGVGGGDEPLHLLRAPVRRSGTALVTKHLETGVPMALHMPRTPTNLRRGCTKTGSGGATSVTR